MTPVPDMQMSLPVTKTAVIDSQAGLKAEFSRLIHAAVINKHFCQNLLANPVYAIEKGYFGERFHFSDETKELIQQLHAESLEQLSSGIMQIVETPSHAEIAVLHCN